MLSISSPGIASGLDVVGLVNQLVAAEGQPAILRLDRKEANLTAEVSALGTLKSAVFDFQQAQNSLKDISAFQSNSAKSGRQDLFSVTADTEAVASGYNVEVTSLAQSEKLASKAFQNTTDEIGTGALTFRFGTYDSDANSFTANPDKSSHSIIIDSANNTLQGIRDAVNEGEIGVTASIINDGTGNRLVFSSVDTGAANGLQITVSGDSVGDNIDDTGLSQLAYDPTAAGVGSGKNLSQNVVAKDAVIVVDGITVTRSSNTLTGVIEGVTLNLIAEEPGTVTTLTVENDNDSISTAVSQFVDSFNTLKQTLDSLTGYDAETGVSGVLLGDATARSIESQIQRVLGVTIDGLSGPLRSLSDIGISTERNGTLVIDSTMLQEAIDENGLGVARLFADSGTASDSLIGFSGFSGDSITGEYAINIAQLATQGVYTGAATSGFPITVDSDNDTFSLEVDGINSQTISLTQGTYNNGAELAAELQSQISGDSSLGDAGISVVVNYQSDHLEIVSSRYGSTSSVDFVSVDTNSSSTLGLSVGAGTAGTDVTGTIGGLNATGSGQTLTGTGDASGISIQVLGGTLGDRGNISIGRGIASQLEALVTALTSNNLLDTRIDGLNDRISDISDDRETLDRRLAVIEERFLAQFSALDVLIGQLQSTSTFLTQQLANLPGPRRVDAN